MLYLAPLLGSVLLASFANARPMPGSSDSSYGGSSDGSYGGDSSDGSYGGGSSDGSYGGGSSDGSSYGGSSYGGSSYGGSSDGSYGSSYGGSYDSSSADTSSASATSTWSSTSAYSTYSAYSSAPTYSSAATYSNSATYSSATYSSAPTYSSPSYGSGMSSWGGSGYNSCVQQCMASASMGELTMPSSTSGGSSGSGATHTVIVAPSQGVLRYVPFAVNASVGDTVLFMWGANNHTVTKSSQLTPCNKTTDALFASGTHNKSFTFTQVVNDTNPTYFYCGTPGHCPKGMFGVINPPSVNNNAGTSAMSMMPSILMNSSDMSAMNSYTQMMTSNNSLAASWGMNIDLSQVPSWAQPLAAQNIMYTQSFLAANPEVLNSDGTVDLSKIGTSGNPAMIPTDLANVNAAAGSASSSAAPTTPASASSAASSATGSATPAGAAKTSGARSLGSSGILAGFVAALATFMVL